MLAFSYMVHFFAYEFSRLRARRLAFAGILMSTFDRFFFRHFDLLSELIAPEYADGIEQFL
jgi:hypothetical protein